MGFSHTTWLTRVSNYGMPNKITGNYIACSSVKYRLSLQNLKLVSLSNYVVLFLILFLSLFTAVLILFRSIGFPHDCYCITNFWDEFDPAK